MRNSAVVMVCALGLAVFGCKSKTSDEHAKKVQAPADAGSAPVAPTIPTKAALADKVAFELGVYFMPRPKTDPHKLLAQILKKHARLNLVKKPTKTMKLPAIAVREPAVKTYAPPAIEDLKYVGRGVDDRLAKAVQKTERVFVMMFFARGADAQAVHASALTIASELAAGTGGLLWDQETRELFTPQRWSARVNAANESPPNLIPLVTVHIYRDKTAMRIVSLGMAKLGLPDLVITDVAQSFSSTAGQLINAIGQTLVEGGNVDDQGRLAINLASVKNAAAKKLFAETKSAAGTGTMALANAVRQKGDPDNRLWKVVFAGKGTLAERQAAAFSTLFKAESKIVDAPARDAELAAASKRARAALMKLKPQFATGVKQGEKLVVKAPFKTDSGGKEFMWFEVSKWSGSDLMGLLLNQPRAVSNLSKGATVEVSESVVFDYIYTRADGSEQGGETNEILQRR